MSYGSGFAQGMQAGSATVGNIMNMVNSMKQQNQRDTLFQQAQDDREQKAGLFKAYQDAYSKAATPIEQEAVGLMGDFKALEQKNNQQQDMLQKFNSASPADMSHFIMEQYKTNGGKINDQTYAIAYGVADGLFKMKNEYAQTQQQNILFDMKVKEFARKATEPLSAEGKLAQDLGVQLTPELVAKNPRLFGKQTDETSLMKEYALFKQNPDFADFIQKTKTPETRSNLEKEYDFYKRNGGDGSLFDYMQGKKQATTIQTPTKVSKLMDEQKQYAQGSREYEIYNNAIKLASEGRESESAQVLGALLGGNVPAPKASQSISQRTIVKTGTIDGKKVVKYSDGTIEYQ